MRHYYGGYYHHHYGLLDLGILSAYLTEASIAQRYGYGPRQGATTVHQYNQDICISDTFTLGYNCYAAYEIVLKPKDNLTFQFEVVNGAPIDIFLLDEVNFPLYKEGKDFSFYKDYSSLNTRFKKYVIDATKMGRYIFVVDNTANPEGQATPNQSINEGKVDIKIFFKGPLAPQVVT